MPHPKPIDEKIAAQWAWARQLGQEWEETEAAGKKFVLDVNNENCPSLPDDVLLSLQNLLPGHHIPKSSPAMKDKERIHALMGAAQSGDMDSYKQLQALFPSASVVAPTTDSVGTDSPPKEEGVATANATQKV